MTDIRHPPISGLSYPISVIVVDPLSDIAVPQLLSSSDIAVPPFF